MKKTWVVVLALLAIFGMLAPPSYAQAPAPKVTINGLVDFAASAYNNLSQGSCALVRRGGQGNGCDVTDTHDNGSHTRQRGVFTLTGEVGRSKGVWAVELDFSNGAGTGNTTTAAPATSAALDLDTDVAGQVETKWLYVETPITGAGSLMPFIPVASLGRFGGQPARGHDYKTGILFSGDFPGVTLETTWAPNVRSTLTYAQIGEALDDVLAAGQTESWAFLASVEVDVFQGLTVKPTYAYASYDGLNCGTNQLGTEVKDGFNPSSPGVIPSATTAATANVAPSTCATSTGGGSLRQYRNYLGVDVRYQAGPLTVQPTLIYEFGKHDLPSGSAAGDDVDISAWLFDTIAGWRTGPLNIQGRVMYTPGMGRQHKVRNGADVSYYQNINGANAYMAGWTEIWTGNIEYLPAMITGNPGATLRQSPSYDKYGRFFVAGAVDYAITPALTVAYTQNISWTDKNVPTQAAFTGNGIICETAACQNGQTADYLGTEGVLGFTYRFAPNIAFDLVGAYLWAGNALNHARVDGGAQNGADDVWKLASRIRLTF